jgi:hypothetical protein
VLDVLDAVDRVTNLKIKRVLQDRRAGDPDALISDNSRIKATLPWVPRRRSRHDHPPCHRKLTIDPRACHRDGQRKLTGYIAPARAAGAAEPRPEPMPRRSGGLARRLGRARRLERPQNKWKSTNGQIDHGRGGGDARDHSASIALLASRASSALRCARPAGRGLD